MGVALSNDVFSLSARWVTTEDVLLGLSTLESSFVTQRDKRGIFATVYTVMTRELAAQVERGEFENPDWIRMYIPAFADLYRQALLAYDADPDSAPKPWRIAFDAARTDSLFIQDVFLGINAHVNSDLPLALRAVTIDPDRESRYRDHKRSMTLCEPPQVPYKTASGIFTPLALISSTSRQVTSTRSSLISASRRLGRRPGGEGSLWSTPKTKLSETGESWRLRIAALSLPG